MDARDTSCFYLVFVFDQPPLQRAPRGAGIQALQQQHHAGGRFLGEV